ncbi:hypothetical protein ACFXK0_05530 [Nocardia sp. NPDC059177]|uniref:hypothetical protein n=1 Tax=Nocardia sp. NPDC059177 TaxID=3346759 RepID=UPI0036B90BA4
MSDDRSIENALRTPDTEITALAQQVATARGKIGLQHDAALYEALSAEEIRAERELAEWIRAQRRKQRRRAVADELAADQRDRRTGALIRRADEADARWHRKALAARRRVSSADARLAQLYRRSEWSSRALIGVVVLGMVWAGVNVQRNLVPSGDMSDPLYWLSYGIEAMISIPIITIMVAATTAARWGRELERGKVLLFELALLGTTVALNAGPHLAAGSFGRAAEYAIAPVMVGVVIWLHAWVSARYALLIESASVELPGDQPGYTPAERLAQPSYPTAEAIAAGATDTEADAQVVVTAPAERAHVPRDARRVATEKPTAPGTLELIHKAAADHRPIGNEHAARPAVAGTRRIPVTAAAQSTAGDATGTDPVPEATAHAGTVARDHNGDTASAESATMHTDPQPQVGLPEQLTLTNEPEAAPQPAAEQPLPEPAEDLTIDEPDEDLDPHDFDDDTEVRALARQIAHRSPLRLTLDQIEEILELTDQSWTARSIGAEVGVSGSTVTNVVDFARKIRQPYAFTG